MIDSIVFVGGTTRIPYFTKLCKEIFGDSMSILNNIDPDQTVSIGAAIRGHTLIETKTKSSNSSDIVLLDIVPMSLGVETIDGVMAPIISKGSIIPSNRSQTFKNTSESGEIEICIYQGNRRFVKDNHFIGSLHIHLQKDSYVQVSFLVDVNGILSVFAESDSSKNSVVFDNFVEKNVKVVKDINEIKMNNLDCSSNSDSELEKIMDFL